MHPCDIVELGRFFDAVFRKKIYPFHYIKNAYRDCASKNACEYSKKFNYRLIQKIDYLKNL